MLQYPISVQDQHGIQHLIQATCEPEFKYTQCPSYLKHITVDGEDIRPSFDMCFQSHISGKIFTLV